jgi:hypothetical protein
MAYWFGLYPDFSDSFYAKFAFTQGYKKGEGRMDRKTCGRKGRRVRPPAMHVSKRARAPEPDYSAPPPVALLEGRGSLMGIRCQPIGAEESS